MLEELCVPTASHFALPPRVTLRSNYLEGNPLGTVTRSAEGWGHALTESAANASTSRRAMATGAWTSPPGDRPRQLPQLAARRRCDAHLPQTLVLRYAPSPPSAINPGGAGLRALVPRAAARHWNAAVHSREPVPRCAGRFTAADVAWAMRCSSHSTWAWPESSCAVAGWQRLRERPAAERAAGYFQAGTGVDLEITRSLR